MIVAFSFLDQALSGTVFIAFAFAIYATAQEFLYAQTSILSLLETWFGLGLICRPTLSGWIYSRLIPIDPRAQAQESQDITSACYHIGRFMSDKFINIYLSQCGNFGAPS